MYNLPPKLDIPIDWTPRPPVICADGLCISIQANGLVYCKPRDWTGPYTHVECGYPSKPIPELIPYAEEPSNPTKTVYPYVPVDLVFKVIDNHGGVAGFKMHGEEFYLKEPVKLLVSLL